MTIEKDKKAAATQPADTVIEQAEPVIAKAGALSFTEAGWIARALHDAGLLADPADQDEEGLQTRLDISVIAAKTFRARAERAEAEVAELRQKVSDCELLLTDLGKTHTRVSAERDELRATINRVREVHRPHACTGYPDCMILFGGKCAHDSHCNHCRKTWPCPTIRALHDAGLLADPADRDEHGYKGTDADGSLVGKLLARAERAEAEVARLRDGAAELAESWRRETANEFAVAASDLDELVNDPEPKQALAMAVAELRATVDRVRGLHREVAIYAYDDTNGVFKQDANGEHIRVESICAECSSDDAIEAVENCEWSADWGHHEIAWPCATIRALDGAGEQ